MICKITDICLAHVLRCADRVVTQLYNEYLAPLDLRVTQFTVLRALHFMKTKTVLQIQDILVI
jgi:DNA-binding MarR family transcriptional regulator